jgi:hypothetical protein
MVRLEPQFAKRFRELTIFATESRALPHRRPEPRVHVLLTMAAGPFQRLFHGFNPNATGFPNQVLWNFRFAIFTGRLEARPYQTP